MMVREMMMAHEHMMMEVEMVEVMKMMEVVKVVMEMHKMMEVMMEMRMPMMLMMTRRCRRRDRHILLAFMAAAAAHGVAADRGIATGGTRSQHREIGSSFRAAGAEKHTDDDEAKTNNESKTVVLHVLLLGNTLSNRYRNNICRAIQLHILENDPRKILFLCARITRSNLD